MKKKKCIDSIISVAAEYLNRGFYVVPIPSGKSHPTIRRWQDLRLTRNQLPQVFAKAAGVGLLLKPSSLVDVDLDCREAVAAAKILLPPTSLVHGRRGNRSSHWFYRVISVTKSKSFHDPRIAPGSSHRGVLVELRANGQTLVPPSIHLSSGQHRTWESKGAPSQCDWVELQKAVSQVAAAALLARCWAKGLRHATSLALAGVLVRSGWSVEAVKTFVRAVAIAARDEELPSRIRNVLTTAKRLAEGIDTTGMPTLVEIIGDNVAGEVRNWLELETHVENQADSTLHNTDLGAARRFVAHHGGNLRFCFAFKKWLVWDGTRWAFDEAGRVERFAKDTVRSIHSEAQQSDDGTNLTKFALKCEGERSIRAMVNLAKSETPIPITPAELDADPWVLNVLNGTICLRNGKLSPHDCRNLCTKLASVHYDERATCPTWIAFLDRIMGGNSRLIKFLQRAVGYSLTGRTTEQTLFFLYGLGANGKSTFVETIRRLLGDYGQQADFDTFLLKNADGPRNDLARLMGARFVAAVEAAEGRKMAEAVVKQVTGGDTIAARFLFHEFFEFVPQFKVFLVANYQPVVSGNHDAIWRRIRLIPFNVTVPPEERDKNLLDKLGSELPGILAWALRGCLEWQRDGLGEPPEVSSATDAYRHEMDVLAEFFDECCIVGGKEIASSAELYFSYKQLCERTGEEILTQKKFGTALREHGIQAGKKRGQRCWRGIRLRDYRGN